MQSRGWLLRGFREIRNGLNPARRSCGTTASYIVVTISPTRDGTATRSSSESPMSDIFLLPTVDPTVCRSIYPWKHKTSDSSGGDENAMHGDSQSE